MTENTENTCNIFSAVDKLVYKNRAFTLKCNRCKREDEPSDKHGDNTLQCVTHNGDDCRNFTDIFWGTFVALAIYTVGFGILYGLGEIEITAVHFSAYDFLLSWILMLLVALAEEIAFRGFVLGHLLTAGVNRFVALFLSSALFSLMHIFNPNFSLIAFLNILLAGILIGSTYIYTRNLWFPIALHLFWNWLQGPILGFEVSGGRLGGTLLSLELPEENIINGGAFGFEGSVLCTALMIIAIAIILKIQSRKVNQRL